MSIWLPDPVGGGMYSTVSREALCATCGHFRREHAPIYGEMRTFASVFSKVEWIRDECWPEEGQECLCAEFTVPIPPVPVPPRLYPAIDMGNGVTTVSLTEFQLIENPCKCSHPFMTHWDSDDPNHPFRAHSNYTSNYYPECVPEPLKTDSAGKIYSFKSCGCGGYNPRYKLIQTSTTHKRSDTVES